MFFVPCVDVVCTSKCNALEYPPLPLSRLKPRSTVLASAVQRGKTEVVRFLLELGADMDLLPSSFSSEGHARDGNAPISMSLIEMAAQLGHLESMNLLIQAKMFKDQAAAAVE